MARGFRYAWPLVRDVLLLGVGAAGILHETFAYNLERPKLLTIFGLIVTAPLFTRDGPRK